MKKLFLISLFLTLFACVGSDTEFLPQTILEARKRNLLIKDYDPSKREVTINQTKYLILESFTTFKYNSKRDQTINKSFFAFIVKLKNLETNEEFLSEAEAFDYTKFINFYCDMCAGLDTDNIALYYDEISKRESLDSIKIGFKDRNKNEKVVYFVQKR